MPSTLCFQNKVCHWPGSHQTGYTDWPTSEPQDPACLHLSYTRVARTALYTQLVFYRFWSSASWFGFVLLRQELYALSHVPRPLLLVFKVAVLFVLQFDSLLSSNLICNRWAKTFYLVFLGNWSRHIFGKKSQGQKRLIWEIPNVIKIISEL